jgi:hypothetical protein
MSVLCVAGGSLLSYLAQNVTQSGVLNGNNNVQTRAQQFQRQDLQSGNLTGTQSVFATLRQNAPSGFVKRQFVGRAAAVLHHQQDFQSAGSQSAGANVATGHGGHHHVPRGDGNTSQDSSDRISQLLNQLGTPLQQLRSGASVNA